MKWWETGLFYELLRGEQTLKSLSPQGQLYRIPSKQKSARPQVKRLLEHAHVEIYQVISTIGNITRWHDGEAIWSSLPPDSREFYERLRTVVFANAEDLEPPE